MDQMGYSFLVVSAIIVAISLLESKKEISKAIPLSPDLFKTETAFNIGAILIFATVATLYIIFW